MDCLMTCCDIRLDLALIQWGLIFHLIGAPIAEAKTEEVRDARRQVRQSWSLIYLRLKRCRQLIFNDN